MVIEYEPLVAARRFRGAESFAESVMDSILPVRSVTRESVTRTTGFLERPVSTKPTSSPPSWSPAA